MLKCGFQNSFAKKFMIDKNLFKNKSFFTHNIYDKNQFLSDSNDIFSDELEFHTALIVTSREKKDYLLNSINDYIFRSFDDQKIAIFYMYFYERLTYHKIAKIYNCSHVYIIKVIKKILKKLTQHIIDKSIEG